MPCRHLSEAQKELVRDRVDPVNQEGVSMMPLIATSVVISDLNSNKPIFKQNLKLVFLTKRSGLKAFALCLCWFRVVGEEREAGFGFRQP